MAFHCPETFRITLPMVKKIKEKFPSASNDVISSWITHRSWGNAGFFFLPNPNKSSDRFFFLIKASDGLGWEHLSISIPTQKRTPTWEEMCHLKDVFWDDSDCVVQYHPAKKDYVNMAPYCLHLWRPTELTLPTPLPIMVGINPTK